MSDKSKTTYELLGISDDLLDKLEDATIRIGMRVTKDEIETYPELAKTLVKDLKNVFFGVEDSTATSFEATLVYLALKLQTVLVKKEEEENDTRKEIEDVMKKIIESLPPHIRARIGGFGVQRIPREGFNPKNFFDQFPNMDPDKD